MDVSLHQAQAAELTPQIARVVRLDPRQVELARHEALTVPSEWIAEYREYQSGGWWTTSLLNDSGRPSDVIIRDCEPVPTTLLHRMPCTRRLLDGLNLHVMWARLARLGTNSFLWEHRDYGELENTERYRLHVPLSTNRSAYLVIGGCKIHLYTGHVWRLTPTFQHGVCNRFGPDRIHLIIDCYADEGFRGIAAAAELNEDDFTTLPTAPEAAVAEHVLQARWLLRLGFAHAAETYLLGLFYRYAFQAAGQVYDLISDLYESTGATEQARGWQAKKRTMLGE